MTETLIPGLKHQILLTVEKHHTADAYGNPGVEVFATPALITLFENVCGECIRPFLSENGFSVGTRVDIRHLGATPLGFEVSAQCEVIEVDRRRVVFRVEAHDGVEKKFQRSVDGKDLRFDYHSQWTGSSRRCLSRRFFLRIDRTISVRCIFFDVHVSCW